jgi:hypothetical protein
VDPRPLRPLFAESITGNIVSKNTVFTCYIITGRNKNNSTKLTNNQLLISVYLDVPSSAITPTDVQLMFNFAAGTSTRSWNIKIALLPCGASYLGNKFTFIKNSLGKFLINFLLIPIAPTDCLQYFKSATGRVKSFNWQDAAGAQQLNNQNYNICFRTELVSSQV